MTYHTIAEQFPVSLGAYAVKLGDPSQGFILQLGPQQCRLTNEQAADLGRYLLFSNNEDSDEPVS